MRKLPFLIFLAQPLQGDRPMMSRSATPAPPPPSSQTSNTIQEVKEAPTKILGTRNETKVIFIYINPSFFCENTFVSNNWF